MTLSKTCNYLEAADELFMAQSTLSRHIQILENDVGMMLFERSTRNVCLSPEGELFLPYAQRMVEIEDCYREAFAKKIEQMKTQLTIGICPTATHYNIYHMLADFMETNANLKLSVVEADSPKLIQMVLDGKCRFALIRDDNRFSGKLSAVNCYSDRAVVLLPADHPAANRERITLQELQNERFSMLSSDEVLIEACRKEFKKSGFLPQVCYMSSRERNVVDTVNRGGCVSLLWKKNAEYFRKSNIALVNIEPEIKGQVNIVYPKDSVVHAVDKILIRELVNRIS